MKNLRYIWFILVIGILAGCGSDPEPRKIEYYQDSEKLLNFTAQQIKDLFNAGGASAFTSLVEHEIIVYKFYYKTTYNGEDINASGLISIPVTEEPVPVVSIQHGTIVNHDDAPSIDWPSYQTLTYFSSGGYIMVIPDYIGFGSSEDILHPYYISKAYEAAIIDMIRAAEEFFYLEGGNFNGEVFLAGYSEGGYATMAAHKAFEDNPIEGFELKASAPAAGGYALTAFRNYFFTRDNYDQPFFMAYVGAAYQEEYFQNTDLSVYFQEPYASEIPGLVSGALSGSQVNSSLTTKVSDLLQPGFMANADTDPLYSGMKDALELNDLSNWLPTIPMYLYHGDADVTVPFSNSITTYQNMVNLGAGANIVSLTTLDGEDHLSGGPAYFFEVVQLINSLK